MRRVLEQAPYSSLIGQRVEVYYNLQTHVWSMLAKAGPNKGRIVCSAERVTLDDCVMRVSESMRQAVLARGKRSFHAGIVGTVAAVSQCPADAVPVSYNPYRAGTFVERGTDRPILRARRVHFGLKCDARAEGAS